MEPQKKHLRCGTPDCPISISYFRKHPKTVHYPRYHLDIEMIYVLSGWMVCQVEEGEITAQAGDILFLTPGQAHDYLSSSQDFRAWILEFPPELFSTREGHVFQEKFVNPLQEGLLRLPQLLREGHPAYEQVILALQWLKYCSNMLKPNYKALRYAMAASICAAVLPWCTQPEVAHSPVDSDNSTIQQVMSFIRRNYLKPLDLQTIADHVHLHPNYLCALFKKHTGQTVMYHLDRTRVDTAVYLLEKSQLTMSQISERSGYRNESVFYYKFKKLTGVSPNQWRQARPGANTPGAARCHAE